MNILRAAKKVFFWSYGRSTVQYDVLCLLILVFIFLTPRSWFSSGETMSGAQQSTNEVRSALIMIAPGNFPESPSIEEIEKKVRLISGNSDLKVKSLNILKGKDGETLGYKVDISK